MITVFSLQNHSIKLVAFVYHRNSINLFFSYIHIYKSEGLC